MSPNGVLSQLVPGACEPIISCRILQAVSSTGSDSQNVSRGRRTEALREFTCTEKDWPHVDFLQHLRLA